MTTKRMNAEDYRRGHKKLLMETEVLDKQVTNRLNELVLLYPQAILYDYIKAKSLVPQYVEILNTASKIGYIEIIEKWSQQKIVQLEIKHSD